MKTLYLLVVFVLFSCTTDDDSKRPVSSDCTCNAMIQHGPDYAPEIHTIEENAPINCETGEYLGEQSDSHIFIGCAD